MIFVIDTNVESLAIKEALKLNIPIVAIIDTNSDPTGIDFPIPGNDDARRAINLYCELIKQTIVDAQKNILTQVSEKTETKEKLEVSETKEKIFSPKEKKVSKPKEKKDTKNKKPKSIFAKIKTLASKKIK